MTDEHIDLVLLDSQNHFLIGVEKFNIGKYQEAIEWFTKSIDLANTVESVNGGSLINRGITWLVLNQYQLAIDDFNNPDLELCNLGRERLKAKNTNSGYAYFHLGMLNKAKEFYEKVLSMDPNNHDALYMLAKM